MNETQILILAAFAGGLMGFIFFGGLWWTIRRGLTSPYAALWFTGSLIVRMSIACAGFYLVGRDHWQRMLACLMGFIVARLLVMRLTSPSRSSPPKEIHNAP